MTILQVILAAVGRLFLSLVFILAALNKILDWQGAELNLSNAISEWLQYTQGIEWAQRIFEELQPRVSLMLLVSCIMQLVGGLLLLFGQKLRLAALLLSLVLAPYIVLFHHFWFLQEAERSLQTSMFLQNLSILGGLLLLLAYGGGKGKKAEDA